MTIFYINSPKINRNCQKKFEINGNSYINMNRQRLQQNKSRVKNVNDTYTHLKFPL